MVSEKPGGGPPAIVMRITSGESTVEIDLGSRQASVGPDAAARLAAEILFIASRVAGRDMRPAFRRHLAARRQS